jgi:replicative DNA helicase
MTTENYRMVLARDLVDELVAENELAVEARRTGKSRGPLTGLKQLDQALGGFLADGVHVLQSSPGGGKSALALQMAANCGFPSLYVSAEMPILELFRRLIARETKTFLGRLKSGELSNSEITNLAKSAVEKTPYLAFLDAASGYVKPETLVEKTEILLSKTKTNKALVVLDSLQYWAKSLDSGSEYEQISLGIRALSMVSASLSLPIIAISHRSRVGNKEGGLHASKGSGDVEYLAESVIELTRDKDSKVDASGKVTVTISIHKNRHGEVGRIIPLEFSGRLQLFTEKESAR